MYDTSLNKKAQDMIEAGKSETEVLDALVKENKIERPVAQEAYMHATAFLKAMHSLPSGLKEAGGTALTPGSNIAKQEKSSFFKKLFGKKD